MLPQRGVPQRFSRGVPPRISGGLSPVYKGALPQRSVFRPSPLGSSGASPWASRPSLQRTLASQKSVLGTKALLGAKKNPPKAPPSFFGEKKYYSKLELRERIRKASPFILKGKMFGKEQRVKMVEQWFPGKSYVKESDVKKQLRNLRGKEYWAKIKDKKSLKYSRKLLEAFTGVRKY